MEPTNEFERTAMETKCSCCDELVGDKSDHVNLVHLPKKAEWEFPAVGNIPYSIPTEYAVALVCDPCLEADEEPEFAVRGEDLERVPIDELEDLQPMSERIER